MVGVLLLPAAPVWGRDERAPARQRPALRQVGIGGHRVAGGPGRPGGAVTALSTGTDSPVRAASPTRSACPEDPQVRDDLSAGLDLDDVAQGTRSSALTRVHRRARPRTRRRPL